MLMHYSYLFSTEKSNATIVFTLGPSRDQITATPTHQAWEFYGKMWKYSILSNYGMLVHYSYIFSTEKSIATIVIALGPSRDQITATPFFIVGILG